MYKIKLIITSILSFAVINCSPAGDPLDDRSITIFAAAGTRSAADEVCDMFEKNNNCLVVRNYASSGTLAGQLVNGAQCDVYVSANKQWIDFLVGKNILDKGSIKTIAGNSLVL